jgi:hypothetical protein
VIAGGISTLELEGLPALANVYVNYLVLLGIIRNPAI